ncbi:MAG: Tex family protein [Lautropia sp.]|nr:Tex family protein [Lautropia sp.]
MPLPLEQRIATELVIRPQQVSATITLLDEGATVPFIARYRKEVTGNLDDTQLRLLAERLTYLRELDARREAILASIQEQGKLTDELASRIDAADSKQRLEDLYAPYKPKRRTKAQIAREAGLEPLADTLLLHPERQPEAEAAAYLKPAFSTPDGDNPGVADTKAALDGARQILMERFAEDADLVGRLRGHLQDNALLLSRVVPEKSDSGTKFADYFDYRETLADIPSHRALALLRGRREEILTLSIRLPDEIDAANGPGWCERTIAARVGIADLGRPADGWLLQTVRWTWQIKLCWQIEGELINNLRERAEEEAIRVFGLNVKDLLLAAPAGRQVTMGLDPGVRTGVKVAVVDGTGKLLETTTIYPHQPRNDWQGSLTELARLCKAHQVALLAVGNGTASRETDRLVGELIHTHPQLHLTRAIVSEAGASVYSASELAAQEFPELDVSLRGAVSIARRLQDPLAELVKIEPKAIGVGQYQHDVSQTRLARALDGVVEDCVNGVGVDLNTASVPLLTRIAGLGPSLAENIVRHRDQHGPFANRQSLLAVSRLGARAFQQAAGFLRVQGGDNPLDGSAVHPEAYPVVQKMLDDLELNISDVVGQKQVIARLDPTRYTNEQFGLPTIHDILKELEKPGRDPRPEFRTASFKEGVETLADLRPGMTLEGVVTNVANFGAFVDIGVHQDGLVHISALSDQFVKDPHQVVKTGDVVKVKVLEVDVRRQRVALTMRMSDTPPASDRHGRPRPAQGSGARPADKQSEGRSGRRDHSRQGERATKAPQNALAMAFANAHGKSRR